MVLGLAVALSLAALAAPAVADDAGSSAASGGSPHFAVRAQFRPGKASGTGEVAVTFAPKDPDVKVNTTPPPRLKLDASQKVLAEKPGAKPAVGGPDEKYVDTTFPIIFPVDVVAAPAGQTVKGSLTYYYCSQRDGWCRKGTADLEIPVVAVVKAR